MRTHNVLLLACSLLAATALILVETSCTAQPSQPSQAQTLLSQAQAVDQAAIAAVAAAEQRLAASPATSPSDAQAQQTLASAEAALTKANAVLSKAQAAGAAIQSAGGNAAAILQNPTVQQTAAAAASAVPSPYSALIAALLPSLMGIAGMAIQSSTHKTAIAAVAGKKSAFSSS